MLELRSLLIKNIQKKVYHFTPIVLVYRCIMCPSAVLFQSTSASTIWRNSKQNFSWGTKKKKKNHSFILSRALGHLPATRLLLLLKASKKQFDKSGFSEKRYDRYIEYPIFTQMRCCPGTIKLCIHAIAQRREKKNYKHLCLAFVIVFWLNTLHWLAWWIF